MANSENQLSTEEYERILGNITSFGGTSNKLAEDSHKERMRELEEAYNPDHSTFLANHFKHGLQRDGNSLQLTAAGFTGQTDHAIDTILAQNQYDFDHPNDLPTDRFYKAYEKAEDPIDVGKAVYEELKGATGLLAENMSQYASHVPAMVAGGFTGAKIGSVGGPAGALAGGTIGTIAGGGAVSVALEYGSAVRGAVNTYLIERGLDPLDRDNIAKAIAEGDLLNTERVPAATKGLILGLVDRLSLGMMGKVASSSSHVITKGAKAAGIQGGSEFTGELLGNLAQEIARDPDKPLIDHNLAWQDATLEGLIGVGASTIEISALSMLNNKGRDNVMRGGEAPYDFDGFTSRYDSSQPNDPSPNPEDTVQPQDIDGQKLIESEQIVADQQSAGDAYNGVNSTPAPVVPINDDTPSNTATESSDAQHLRDLLNKSQTPAPTPTTPETPPVVVNEGEGVITVDPEGVATGGIIPDALEPEQPEDPVTTEGIPPNALEPEQPEDPVTTEGIPPNALEPEQPEDPVTTEDTQAKNSFPINNFKVGSDTDWTTNAFLGMIQLAKKHGINNITNNYDVEVDSENGVFAIKSNETDEVLTDDEWANLIKSGGEIVDPVSEKTQADIDENELVNARRIEVKRSKWKDQDIHASESRTWVWSEGKAKKNLINRGLEDTHHIDTRPHNGKTEYILRKNRPPSDDFTWVGAERHTDDGIVGYVRIDSGDAGTILRQLGKSGEPTTMPDDGDIAKTYGSGTPISTGDQVYRVSVTDFENLVGKKEGGDTSGSLQETEIQEEGQEEQEKTKVIPTSGRIEAESIDAYKTRLKQALSDAIDGDGIKNNNALKKIMQGVSDNPKTTPSPLEQKDAQELIEVILVDRAHKISRGEGTLREKFDAIIALTAKIPNLNIRTSESMDKQQYSTPAPLAYAVSIMSGVAESEDGNPYVAGEQPTIYEPTAGNGMLLIGSERDNYTFVNELDPNRVENLKSAGFTNVWNVNILTDTPTNDIGFEVVVANPPFGKHGMLRNIDQIILKKSMERLADDGTAVFIISGDQTKKVGNISPSDQKFFRELTKKYNVTDVFEVGGNLYKSQGTTYPVRVIKIEGKTPTSDETRLSWLRSGDGLDTHVDRFTTWDEVYERSTRKTVVSESTGDESLIEDGDGTLDKQSTADKLTDEKRSSVKDKTTTGGRGGGVGQVVGVEPKPDDTGSSTRRLRDNNGQPTQRNRNATGDVGKSGESIVTDPNKQPTGDTDTGDDVSRDSDGDERTRDLPTDGTPRVSGSGVAPKAKQADGSSLTAKQQEEAKQALSDLGSIFEDLANVKRITPEEKAKLKARLFEPLSKLFQIAISAGYKKFKESAKFVMQQISDAFGTIAAKAVEIEQLIGAYISNADPTDVDTTSTPDIYSKDGGFVDADGKVSTEVMHSELLDTVEDVVVEESTDEQGTQLDKLEEQGSEYQVPYPVKSRGFNESVLIPVALKEPTERFLDKLESEVGDIDQYVAEELGYESVDELWKGLMGLQVDGVASAIYNINNGGATIIADQTGVGKGRQAAALIRYAKKIGKIPVFVTVDPNLFTDMWDDLADIGTTDIVPFIVNDKEGIKVKVTSTTAEPTSKLIHTTTGTKRDKIFKGIIETGELPDGISALFFTYSQITSDNIQRKVVKAISDRALFVLDEAHNIAGAKSSTKKGITKTSGAGFMTEVISGKPTVYLSATFAKTPDNLGGFMNTDLRIAVRKADDISTALAVGGIPLQTITTSTLAEYGQVMRRERSFEGIEVNKTVLHDHKEHHTELFDSVTTVLRAIVEADRSFHEVDIKNTNEVLKMRFEKMSGDNAVAPTLDHTSFSSTVHNYISQILLAVKVEDAVDWALKAHENDEKVLIGVQNTMMSFLDSYTKERGLSFGDAVDANFSNILERALDRTLIVKAKGSDDPHLFPITNLSEGTGELYTHAYTEIESMSQLLKNLVLPISPIDYIIQRLADAHVDMGEITGRDIRLDYSDSLFVKDGVNAVGTPTFERRIKPNKRDVVDDFNSGELDGLILNQAGSTGLSAHAAVKFDDRRVRHMLVLQPMGDINRFMQLLGRINRTGQVELPKYTLLSTALPSEIRSVIVLARKLASLNANTSANDKSDVSVDAPDIFNKYGDEIVNDFLLDNPEIMMVLGLKTDVAQAPKAPQIDIAQKFTGRAALLDTHVLDGIYRQINAQFKDKIDYLNTTGQNELTVAVLDLRAKILESRVFLSGDDPTHLFGVNTVLHRVSMKSQGKPPKGKEVAHTISRSLGGSASPSAFAQSIIDSKLEADRSDDFTQSVRDTIERLGQQKRALELESREEKHPESEDAPDYKKELKEVNDGIANAIQRLESIENSTQLTKTAILQDFTIGRSVELNIEGEVLNGVVVNVKDAHQSGIGSPYSLGKTTVTFMVASGIRQVTLPLTKLVIKGGTEEAIVKKLGKNLIEGGVKSAGGAGKSAAKLHKNIAALTDILKPVFDAQANREIREERIIATGNLIAVASKLNGNVIRFTDERGVTYDGFLTTKQFAKDFDMSSDSSQPFLLSKPEYITKFLTTYGGNDKVFGPATAIHSPTRAVQIVPFTRDGSSFKISISSSSPSGKAPLEKAAKKQEYTSVRTSKSLENAIGLPFAGRNGRPMTAVFSTENMHTVITELMGVVNLYALGSSRDAFIASGMPEVKPAENTFETKVEPKSEDDNSPEILSRIMGSSRDPQFGDSMSTDEVGVAAQRMVAELKLHDSVDSPRIQVYATQVEAFGSEATVDKVGIRAGGYDPVHNVVILIAEHMHGDEDVRSTMRHEVIAHYGLNLLDPKEKKSIIDKISASRKVLWMSKIWKKIDERYGDSPESVKAEEVLAYLAESKLGKAQELFMKIASFIAKVLRKMGFFKGKTTVAELHSIINRLAMRIREKRHRYETNSENSQQVMFMNRGRGGNTFAESLSNTHAYLRRKFTDSLQPLADVQDSYGEVLPDKQDVHGHEKVSKGKVGTGIEDFTNGKYEQLMSVMKKHGISLDDLDLFVYVKHADERNTYIASINDGMPDGGSGLYTNPLEVTDEHLEKLLKDGETIEDARLNVNSAINGLSPTEWLNELQDNNPQTHENLLEAAQIAWNINRDTLAELKRGGIISEKVKDILTARNQYYVPLKGGDQYETTSGSGSKFSILGTGLGKAMGRRSMAESPIIHTIAGRMDSIVRVNKNLVGNKVVELVMAHPDKKLWSMSETHFKSYVSLEREGTEGGVGAGEMFFGIDSEELAALKDQVVDSAIDKNRVIRAIETTDVDTGEVTKVRKVVMIKDNSYVYKDSTFTTMFDGKVIAVTIHDKLVLNALKGSMVSDESDIMRVFQILSSYQRFLSKMYTSYSPNFIGSNAQRDIEAMLINAYGGAEFSEGSTQSDFAMRAIKNIKDAFFGIREFQAGKNTTWAKNYKQMRKAGGSMSYANLRDADALMKEVMNDLNRYGTIHGDMLAKGGSVFKAIDNFNSAIENTVRLSVFEAGIHFGLSEHKSAKLSRDISVDHGKKGEWGQVIGALYMFGPTTIQSGVNLIHRLFTSHRYQKVVALLIGLGFILAMKNSLDGGEDDEGKPYWDQIPHHYKRSRLIYLFDDGTSWNLRLPYGAAIFPYIGTLMYEAATKPNTSIPDIAEKLILSASANFNPLGGGDFIDAITPTALKLPVQAYRNVNWMGTNVYPSGQYDDRNKMDHLKTWDSTNKTLKDIMKAFNDLSITDNPDSVFYNDTYDTNQSGFIDVSPEVVKLAFSHLTGGFGSSIVTLGKLGAKIAEGEGGDIALKDIPVAQTFTMSWKADPLDMKATRDEYYSLKEAAKTISSGYDLRTKDGQKYREDHSNIINLNSMTRRYDEDISYQKGELKGLDPLSDKYKSIRSNIKHRYNSFIGEYEKAYAEDEEYRRNQSR